MPCGYDPQIVSESILAILHDESDQASLHKTDNPVLLWIITALVFDVGEA